MVVSESKGLLGEEQTECVDDQDKFFRQDNTIVNT